MTANNPQIAELLTKLEQQPNLTSTTPGPRCPQCGGAFLIFYGSASKYWRVMHSGAQGDCRCSEYGVRHPSFLTQADAIAHADALEKGEA